MSRGQIKEVIYGALRSSAALTALWGGATSANRKIYTMFPQTEPALSTFEPDEGWLVIEEYETTTAPATLIEDADIRFHIFVTRLTLADDVIDILDQLFDFRYPQERDLEFGERLVLYSKRVQVSEAFAEALKMYEKTAHYLMRLTMAQVGT